MLQITSKQSKWGLRLLPLAAALSLSAGTLAHATVNGILMPHTIYEAGVVKKGAIINHDMRFYNFSYRKVLVSTIANCGCTTVDMTERPLSSFGRLIASAKVDTAGMHVGRHNTGIDIAFRAGADTWTEHVAIQYTIQ